MQNLVIVSHTACWHIGSSKKFWGHWGPSPCDGVVVADPLETRPSQERSVRGISVYIPPKSIYLKKFMWFFSCDPGQIRLTYVLKLQWLVKTYTPKKTFLATPLSLPTCYRALFGHCRAKAQRYKCAYGDLPRKWGVVPLKVTEGHWNRHRSVGLLWLLLSDP